MGDNEIGKSFSSYRIEPLVIFSRSSISFAIVVLRLPDSPARTKHAPLSIENVTPSTAFSILYFLSITPFAAMGKCLTNSRG